MTSPPSSAARTHDIQSPTAKRALFLLLLLATAYFAYKNLVWRPLQADPGDFYIYRQHTIEALQGTNPFLDPKPYDGLAAYAYPTFFLSVILPFTLVTQETAKIIWWGINLAIVLSCMLSGLLYLRRRARPSGPLGNLGILSLGMLCAAVGYAPVSETLQLGQNNIIVLGLVLAAFWMGTTQKRIGGGVAFALAILCKIHPMLLLPGLALALGWLGVATAACVGALYLAVLGTTGLWEWEWFLFAEKIPHWVLKTNSTTMSIFHLLVNDAGMGVPTAHRAAQAAEGAIFLAMVAGVLMLWRRGAGPLWMLAWSIALSLPMSRFLEFHHLLLLIVPLVVLVAEGERTGRWTPLCLAAVCYACVNIGHVLVDLTVPVPSHYLHYVACFVCAGAVMSCGLRSAREERDGATSLPL